MKPWWRSKFSQFAPINKKAREDISSREKCLPFSLRKSLSPSVKEWEKYRDRERGGGRDCNSIYFYSVEKATVGSYSVRIRLSSPWDERARPVAEGPEPEPTQGGGHERRARGRRVGRARECTRTTFSLSAASAAEDCHWRRRRRKDTLLPLFHVGSCVADQRSSLCLAHLLRSLPRQTPRQNKGHPLPPNYALSLPLSAWVR